MDNKDLEQAAGFADPEGTPESGESSLPPDMAFLLDIPLEVTVQLGKTRMCIKDLLELGEGDIVEMTRQAGEPMEVFINGKLFALGEAVMVEDHLGVRLTDIVSPEERLKTLG